MSSPRISRVPAAHTSTLGSSGAALTACERFAPVGLGILGPAARDELAAAPRRVDERAAVVGIARDGVAKDLILAVDAARRRDCNRERPPRRCPAGNRIPPLSLRGLKVWVRHHPSWRACGPPTNRVPFRPPAHLARFQLWVYFPPRGVFALSAPRDKSESVAKNTDSRRESIHLSVAGT